MEALRPLADRTDVYVDPYIYKGKDGFRDFVYSYPGKLLRVPSRADKSLRSLVPRYNVVFFISPETSPGFTRFFINASRPTTVVHMIHNADDPGVGKLAAMHPRTRLLALSPHVVSALRERGFGATWWLAAWPPESGPNGRDACPAMRNGSVPTPWGFVCQGRIDSQRRSYDSLWSDLQAAADEGKAGAAARPPPELKILGRSVSKERQLTIPMDVRHLVTRYANAPYKKFTAHIACSLALLPLFADESYYTVKFSSTVLASLSTGTPILADERLLASYTFLDRRTVFLQGKGEGLVAAMQRVEALGAAEHSRRRAALAELREGLNAAARKYLVELIEEGAAAAAA